MTPADKMAKEKKPRGKQRFDAVWECDLNRLRTSKRLSLRDVEKGTGLTNATLWRIEQGADLTLFSAVKIARFFGVNIGDIWKIKPTT